MAGWIEISALILATVAIILVIVIHVFSFHDSFRIRNEGTYKRIELGTLSSANEFLETGNNLLYVAQSNQPQTLTINPDNKNLSGRTFEVKNNSADNLTLDVSNLAGFNGGQLPTSDERIVRPGQYSSFIFTGTNRLLRLD